MQLVDVLRLAPRLGVSVCFEPAQVDGMAFALHVFDSTPKSIERLNIVELISKSDVELLENLNAALAQKIYKMVNEILAGRDDLKKENQTKEKQNGL